MAKKVNKEDEVIYNPYQALRLVRCNALSNIQETLMLQIRLNVDPRHGDQLVRGTCRMPHSLGGKQKLAVYVQDEQLQQKCLDLGADVIVTDKMIEDIKNGGKIEFEKLVTTVDSQNSLKAAARYLGPLGLMPNVKLGTVVQSDQLEQLVKDAKVGVVTFRVNAEGVINAPLGKIDLSNDAQLLANFKTFIDLLVTKKPEKVKNKYFQSLSFKSTQGPPFKIKVEYIDPRNKNCMINDL